MDSSKTSSLKHFAAAVVLSLYMLSSASAAKGDRLLVATTFTVIADLAMNVAGDAADVVSITRPGAEIHDYQPTPRDLLRVRDADIVLWNGLGLERWFEKFISRVKGATGVVVSEGVKPLPIRDGPYSNKPNPHAWMSPDDVSIYVNNIEAALSAADPDNADTYRKNADAYLKQIESVAADIRTRLEEVPASQRWLATTEGAFSYLAREFALEEIYLWPINADAQGTPKQVKAMIDAIRENKIPVVFSESTVSDKPAKQVARETGAAYGGVLYVDSLSEADGAVPTYLDLLRVTTETVARGLEGAAGEVKLPSILPTVTQAIVRAPVTRR